jgi:hypothetical protein
MRLAKAPIPVPIPTSNQTHSLRRVNSRRKYKRTRWPATPHHLCLARAHVPQHLPCRNLRSQWLELLQEVQHLSRFSAITPHEVEHLWLLAQRKMYRCSWTPYQRRESVESPTSLMKLPQWPQNLSLHHLRKFKEVCDELSMGSVLDSHQRGLASPHHRRRARSSLCDSVCRTRPTVLRYLFRQCRTQNPHPLLRLPRVLKAVVGLGGRKLKEKKRERLHSSHRRSSEAPFSSDFFCLSHISVFTSIRFMCTCAPPACYYLSIAF